MRPPAFLRPSLAASSSLGPTARLAPPSHAARTAQFRPFTSSTSTPAPYRRFGDRRDPLPSSRPGPTDLDASKPEHLSSSARANEAASAQQVFELLRSATGRRGGAGAGRSGFRAGGGGRPSLHNFKAYLRASTFPTVELHTSSLGARADAPPAPAPPAGSPVFLVLVAGGGTYYVLHLEKVPETGRWRFMDVSPDMEKEMGAQGLQEVMGEYGGKVLPDYHPTARHVQSVVKRLIRANGLEDKLGGDKEGWKTHVVKEDGTKKCVAALSSILTIAGRKLTLCLPRSAFVLPNGSIFVFTGILSVANDEDSLACVLGHGASALHLFLRLPDLVCLQLRSADIVSPPAEIAHQVARHSAERMSGMKVRQVDLCSGSVVN